MGSYRDYLGVIQGYAERKWKLWLRRPGGLPSAVQTFTSMEPRIASVFMIFFCRVRSLRVLEPWELRVFVAEGTGVTRNLFKFGGQPIQGFQGTIPRREPFITLCNFYPL